MPSTSKFSLVLSLSAAAFLMGCGANGLSNTRQPGVVSDETLAARQRADEKRAALAAFDTKAKKDRGSVFDLFRNQADSNVTVAVNKYLWQASLEVLSFLPVETVDPFTGVISTGYGTPPGGGRAYRATIYVQDPALEARSLKVALSSQSGPVAAGTVRAIEDAILMRARQLRLRDGDL